MVTEDEIKEGQKKIIRQEKFINDTEKNHRLIDEKFQKLKRLKDDFEVLEKKKKEWKELEKQEAEMAELEKRIKEFEKISGIFAAPLKELNQLKIKNKELIDHQARVKKNLKRVKLCWSKRKRNKMI